jgi:hypothetical protein
MVCGTAEAVPFQIKIMSGLAARLAAMPFQIKIKNGLAARLKPSAPVVVDGPPLEICAVSVEKTL